MPPTSSKSIHLQEVGQTFNVRIDTHPLVVNPGHVNECAVTNGVPEAIEHENEMPMGESTHASLGIHTTLRLRMRCRISVQ